MSYYRGGRHRFPHEHTSPQFPPCHNTYPPPLHPPGFYIAAGRGQPWHVEVPQHNSTKPNMASPQSDTDNRPQYRREGSRGIGRDMSRERDIPGAGSEHRDRSRSGDRHSSQEQRTPQDRKRSQERNKSQGQNTPQSGCTSGEGYVTPRSNSKEGNWEQGNKSWSAGGNQGYQDPNYANWRGGRHSEGSYDYSRQAGFGRGRGNQGGSNHYRNDPGTPRRWNEDDPDTFLSKTLSSILRHNAERFQLQLMKGGFVYVDEILHKVHKLRFYHLEDVQRIVASNDKKRFALENEGGRWKIRANQGHTIEVDDLDLRPIESADEFPTVIHGTYFESWEQIKTTGLRRMKRNHIHFAAGEPGNNGVISGMRSSCEVMIYIDLEKALKAGIKFFVSANNVILSPGDKDGIIYPCFFKGAMNRGYRSRIMFDNTISSGRVPGQPPSGGEEKKKRKKGKGKQKESRWDTPEESTTDESLLQTPKKTKNEQDNTPVGSQSGSDEVDGPADFTDMQVQRLSDSTERIVSMSDRVPGNSAAPVPVAPSVPTAAPAPVSAPVPVAPSVPTAAPTPVSAPEPVAPPVATAAPAPVSAPEPEAPQVATAPPVAIAPPVPEWKEPVMVEDVEQSKCAIDTLTSSTLSTIVVCHFGENYTTENSKLRLLVLLAKPNIFVYNVADNTDLVTEGNLGQVFFNKDSKKVFLGIGDISYSLIREFDILLDGCPVWDIQLMFSKVRGTNNKEMNKFFEDQGIKPNIFKHWKEAVSKKDSEDDIVSKLVDQGKQMLPMFEELHGFLEKDKSLNGSVKKEVFAEVRTKDRFIHEKIDQLKKAKKEKEKAQKGAEKQSNVVASPQGKGGKKNKKKK